MRGDLLRLEIPILFVDVAVWLSQILDADKSDSGEKEKRERERMTPPQQDNS